MKKQQKSFTCHQCGACCRAPGEVWLNAGEPARIANALGMQEEAFLEKYTHLTRNRCSLTLTQREDGACIFLEPDNRCRIHEVKPQQCRDYPTYWRNKGLDAICEAQAYERKLYDN